MTRAQRWLILCLCAGTAVLAYVTPPVPLNRISCAGFAAGTAALAAAVAWRWPRTQAAWIAAALVGLIGAGVTYRAYVLAADVCTAPYFGSSMVIGTELVKEVREARAHNPGLTNQVILENAAGDPKLAWTEQSIHSCTARLLPLAYLWPGLLGVAFISSVVLAGERWRLRGPTVARAPAGTPRQLRYDVFVSYRHGGEDGEFARRLVVRLEEWGFRVAIDERDFRAEERFLPEIERCIKESRFTVALLSARYLQSGNTEEEALITKVLDMEERKRRLVPLILEKVEMPVWLYGIVGIDFTAEGGLVEPLDRLKETLGKPLPKT
ncbi:MAG: toll/interleukin-1 receptor domain-containing protein [Bryobacteraceae bacterium]